MPVIWHSSTIASILPPAWQVITTLSQNILLNYAETCTKKWTESRSHSKSVITYCHTSCSHQGSAAVYKRHNSLSFGNCMQRNSVLTTYAISSRRDALPINCQGKYLQLLLQGSARIHHPGHRIMYFTWYESRLAIKIFQSYTVPHYFFIWIPLRRFLANILAIFKILLHNFIYSARICFLYLQYATSNRVFRLIFIFPDLF